MISNKILPVHILRLYTWELLQQNNGMSLVDGRVPIIPLGEEPQLADANKTYLVYGYAENQAGVVKEIKRGVLSYRIVARTFGELGAITNTLLRAFENLDESADQVNHWSSQYGAADLNGIRFTSIEVSYVDGGEAGRTESGPVTGLVNINYNYVTHQQVKVFSRGGWNVPQ